MFPAVMSNSTSLSHEEASNVSSCTTVHDLARLNPMVSTISPQQPQKIKKKRNLPGNPDPDAEVIALSPRTLLATNRFVCEICNKGFQRDQNLQLHRRGHNLPWKLKQRNKKEIRKRAYVCPVPTCVHHHPSRALGDLTGIKKHFCRKHGEKKWKCDKCSKIYAVQSDWKAHSKICGTREYRCDCGTLFSRKDSFITHRAFCDALAEESARLSANQWRTTTITTTKTLLNSTTHGHAQLFHLPPQNPLPLFSFTTHQQQQQQQQSQQQQQQQQSQTSLNPWNPPQNPNPNLHQNPVHIKPEIIHLPIPPPPTISSSPFFLEAPVPQPQNHRHLHASAQPTSKSSTTSAHLSATALLQKAATVGAQSVGQVASTLNGLDKGAGSTVLPPEYLGFAAGSLSTWKKSDDLTRDFLGLTGECGGGGGDGGGGVDVSVNVRNLLSFTGGVELAAYERDHSLLKSHGFGFAEPPASETWGNSRG